MLFKYFFSVATLSLGVFIFLILVICYEKYKRRDFNLQFDYLSYYFEDPVELQQYRERNRLDFEEEVNTTDL
jgi:hypothetical protein